MSVFFDAFKIVKGDSIEKVSKDIWKSRLEKCRDCVTDGEWTVSGNGRCKLCGCFVNQKTKYADESCPKGEWEQETQK
jgi:hypothetical protein